MNQSNSSAPKIALVTGATGAIGKAIAEGIAAQPGFEVVLAARNESKARRTIDDIVRATRNQRVRYELVDLSLHASIRELANRWKGPLHVLVNNAAATPRRREETSEGIEVQFATNVLGYVWMIQAFEETLKRSAPARVVNVASYWAGGLDLDDLEFQRRRYDNDDAYRQSKQANRMLSAAFAERLSPHGITVNSCHPGDVNSALSNSLGFGGHELPEQGADTPVWLAVSPDVEGVTGRYYAHRRPDRCRFSENHPAVERLYRACLSYTTSK